MSKKLFPRLLLTFIGTLFILWGTGRLMLGIAGEQGTAVITSIRRQGGERSDGMPGRYTYSIGYTFIMANGKQINGSTTKIGDAVYLKAAGTSTLPVRYFIAVPYINAPEEETRLSPGLLLIIAAGTFLIVVINTEPKKKMHAS